MSILFMIVVLSGFPPAAQASAAARPADCREWRQCRQFTLDALAAGDFERAHDLAWKTSQLGPPRDQALMYLLARAQSLSGRPHDALVMLTRLAEMGASSDAATNDDFQSVRALPDWARLDALLAGRAPGAPIVPATDVATRSPDRPTKVDEALRLPGAGLKPRGLAYDAASGRFVVGDRAEGKLVIIDERSLHVVDLVRSSSAGFHDITAFEIDARRGDLWVVSGGQSVAALHKLQLVSGRPLDTIALPEELLPGRFEDVAITPAGAVFVLDAAGGRLLRLDPKARTFVVVAAVPFERLTSIAPLDERVVYVAHASGVVRVDVSTGAVTPLRGAADDQLAGLERIRFDRSSLVGIQRLPDGGRRAVSIRLAGGRAAAVDVVEADVLMSDPTAATLSGDSFYFLIRGAPGTEPAADLIVRRLRLR